MMLTLPDNLRELCDQLATFCAARGVSAWLVGGAARDLALGRVPSDIDVAVEGDGVALARAFANRHGGAFVALDDERGTGRVVLGVASAERLVIDLVQLRAPTLDADLRLRDFTINALALPLLDQQLQPMPLVVHPAAFIDPCAGLADLAAGQLRPCSPQSISDDPLRMLRAVRFAADLGLRVAPELHAAIHSSAPLISRIAAERVRDELLKLLALPTGATWLPYLDEVRVLTQLFPELEAARNCAQPSVHFLPVLAHMLETAIAVEWLLNLLLGIPAAAQPGQLPVAVQTHPDLRREFPYAAQLRTHFAVPLNSGHSRPALLKLAALLHDNAKPQTRERHPDGHISFYGHQDIGAEVAARIGQRLRLSRSELGYLALVVRQHMRPGQLRTAPQLTLRAVVRFFRDTADAGPDLLFHELADHLATRGPHTQVAAWSAHIDWVGAMLDVQWGKPPERVPPLLNGNEVMAALGLAPGKLVGEILREIHEAQAVGEISTQAEALELARQVMERQR